MAGEGWGRTTSCRRLATKPAKRTPILKCATSPRRHSPMILSPPSKITSNKGLKTTTGGLIFLFSTISNLSRGRRVLKKNSSTPPKSSQDLEERLRSRFEAGLIADISDPDYETRLAILKSKSETKKPEPPAEILEYIASAIDKNIRELEGALNLILARMRISGKNLSLEEVQLVLSQVNTRPKRIITASKIIK